MGKRSIDRLSEQRESIEREIEQLKTFRQTKQTRLLLRHLFAENSLILRKIRKLQQSTKSKQEEIQQRRQRANINRSHKMKRSWNYFRTIHQNYLPNMSVKEIRSQFSKFKRGLETDISEIIWRNPSPWHYRSKLQDQTAKIWHTSNPENKIETKIDQKGEKQLE